MVRTSSSMTMYGEKDGQSQFREEAKLLPSCICASSAAEPCLSENTWKIGTSLEQKSFVLFS